MRSALHRCRARSRVVVATLVAFAVAAAASVGVGTGASTSTVVTADVASAISLTNSCTSAAATQLTGVTPGVPARTATDGTGCRIGFSSSNDSALLRIGQRDATGGAMQSAGSWSSGSAASSEAMNDVFAIDSLVRVAVGRGGTFYRTADGGGTWDRWAGMAGLHGYFNSVVPVPGDSGTCYTVGTAAAVVRISNCASGVPAFASLKTGLVASGWPSTTEARGVEVLDANTFIVVGDGGWVARSVDGGSSFEPAFQVAGASTLYDIDALSSGTLYASGQGSTSNVWVTTTGGGSAGAWTGSTTKTWGALDLEVVNSSNIYVVGSQGQVLRFDGSAWQERPADSLVLENLDAVASTAADPLVVYVSGRRGQLARSVDGGLNWTRVTTKVVDDLSGMDATGPNDVIAVGGRRIVVRTTTGTTWQPSYGVAGASSREGLAAHQTNGQLALATGSEGSVRRTIDGGQSWTSVSTPATVALTAVAFGSGNTAWAVGEDGVVIRSTDGGLSWSTQTSNVAVRLWSIAAFDALRAWAVGDGGTIIRTTDGGATWRTMASGTSVMLRDVEVLDAETLVAVGRGTVRRTTDGGATWTAAATVPSLYDNLVSVSAGSRSVLYAASYYRRIWKSSDGGDNWTSFSSGGSDQFSVSAVDEQTLYVAGSWGDVRRITGGGTTSTVVDIASGDQDMRGIVATGRESAIAVGENDVWGWAAPSTAANRLVTDYGATASSNWAGTGSSSMFGVCIQGTSPATTAAWTVDTTPSGAVECAAADSDPWYGVPAAATKIASTSTAGALGSVDLVWGMRAADDQVPGTYAATVVFEAIAPNA